MSVPGLFRPYGIANPRSGEIFEYVDGEVRETLSMHVARDTGAELVIVSKRIADPENDSGTVPDFWPD